MTFWSMATEKGHSGVSEQPREKPSATNTRQDHSEKPAYKDTARKGFPFLSLFLFKHGMVLA